MADSIASDPFAQNMTLWDPAHDEQFEVPLPVLFQYVKMGAATGIIFGVQIGISFVLLIVMAIMTKPEKRRTPIFMLNFTALFFLWLNGTLQAVSLTGAFYNFYSIVTGYYGDINHAVALSATAEVTHFLLELALELSTMLQVNVVCCVLLPRYRHILTGFSALVIMANGSLRFTLMVANIDFAIVHAETVDLSQLELVNQLAEAHNILFITTIYYFSGIFCAKLGHAIWQRRKFAMQEFAPMHIVFIVACQTLLIPATFGVLACFVLRSAHIQALMYVTLAASVPLSGLWATANTSNKKMVPAYRAGNEECSTGLKSWGSSGTDSFASSPRRFDIAAEKTAPLADEAPYESVSIILDKSSRRLEV